MKVRIQFAKVLLVLSIGAAVAAPSYAQRPRASAPPAPHPRAAAQQRNPNRPPQGQQKKQQQNKPQGNGANRPATTPRENDPNRPPASYNQQPQRKFSDLSPAEKQKYLEYNRKYQNLSPAQKQEMQDRVQAWNHLTPAQQAHIRKDVLPKWRQLPQERRQAIRQRLRILQNMPESARNQRLNDPEFTRGMNDEDKATLRDLSHLHVGGAPDPPGE